MRLRIPELFEERHMTPYAVARLSDGRLDEGTMYRLARQRGRVKAVSLAMLEALCDVLEVAPSVLFDYVRATPPGRNTARKNMNVDVAKLRHARALLGTNSEAETIDRALDLVIMQADVNQPTENRSEAGEVHQVT